MICLLATLPTGVTHERVCCPSISTVHAPHCDSPQPYFVPVISRSLRNTLNRLVCGSTSTVNFFPLTISAVTFAIAYRLPALVKLIGLYHSERFFSPYPWCERHTSQRVDTSVLSTRCLTGGRVRR